MQDVAEQGIGPDPNVSSVTVSDSAMQPSW